LIILFGVILGLILLLAHHVGTIYGYKKGYTEGLKIGKIQNILESEKLEIMGKAVELVAPKFLKIIEERSKLRTDENKEISPN
jgi:hypothetical protein